MDHQANGPPTIAYASAPAKRTHYRWVICGLLFFATTINYIDRAVIGVLKPVLMDELHWSERDFAWVMSCFQVAYAFGYMLAGRLIDVIGTRLGYALSVLFWTIAAMAHGLHLSLHQFGMARAALGLAEGGNFPGAVKTVGEWFPRKERSLATGIFNCGSNIGALVTPLCVPWITIHHGWRASFVITAAIGFLWIVAWLWLYGSPDGNPRVSRAEIEYIQSDPPDPAMKMGWLTLLRYRAVWAFVVGMGLSAPIWWFYLYWIPGYLNKQHGLDIASLGPPLIAIYLAADVGSIAGGWFSSALLKRGWSNTASRKTAMLVCALCVVPVFLTANAKNVWLATGLVSLAAAAHQGWSANLFTMVGDTMPRGAISSVVGLGGFVGSMIGGLALSPFVGWVLDATGSYAIPFAIASGGYLVALLIIHLLLPRFEPVEIESPGSEP